MSSDAFYWRSFSVFCRLLGFAFVLGGAVVAASPFIRATDYSPSRHPFDPGREATITVAVGLVVALLGVLLLYVRPFRPDLGDTSILVDPVGARAQRRWPRSYSWWTGDSRAPTDSAAV
jgi:hypothetical protein